MTTQYSALPAEKTNIECELRGMDCPDCAAKVERVAASLPGVDQVRVDFTRQRLRASTSSPAAARALRDKVRSLGYDLVDPAQPVTSELIIPEMDCSEEEQLVEKALGGLDGLLGLQIHVVTQKVILQHDPQMLPLERIVQRLAEFGLHARAVQGGQERRAGWRRHIATWSTAAAGLFTALGLILPLVGGDPWLAKLFLGLAIAIGGWPVARKGIAAARHGALDMNVLMMVAVTGALFIDAWGEGAMVVFLFALAQELERRSMDRARRAVQALMELAPPTARVLRDGREIELPVEQVRLGDLFRLRPGDKVPLDGEVVDGHSAVDQAPITGESIPVEKAPGDTLYAGSINQQGSLDVRVTHLAGDTTLAQIGRLIEQAQSARAPAQAFVERFARYYTPAVIVIAVLVAAVPPLLLGLPFDTWFYRALVLLVIACPCALVISTPVAVVSGLARGARAGVLIKGGIHLENAGHLTTLAFDKTGTLTEGRPRVEQIEALADTPTERVLQVAATLESRSEHPLARAVMERAREQGIDPLPVDRFQSLTGLGVEATIDGEGYLLGNHRLFEERGLCSPEIESWLERWEQEGRTVVIVGSTTQVLGLIGIADQIRPEAPSALQQLRRLGVENLVMLTGDNRGTARAIAERLGIDQYRAELLPVDKVSAVQELVRQSGHVGMVGDGVNDAPAMASANIGIAMGAAGTDAALETADLVLMSDDLNRLPFAIRLSRATLGTIRQNIAVALGLKALFLVLAIGGWATLWMAVFADTGASVLVVLNSLRLLKMESRSRAAHDSRSATSSAEPTDTHATKPHSSY